MIERNAKEAAEWIEAKERGELRPVTLADLQQAMADRAKRGKPKARAALLQLSPYAFLVRVKP